MIEFAWAFIFWLLPLPFLVYFLLPAKKTAQTALFIPFLQHYQTQTVQATAANPDAVNRVIMVLIWLMLIFAAAKPVQIGDAIEMPTTGRDIFLAVDISGSMQIDDMVLNGRRVDRLTMVKAVLSDFIEQRQGDRLGLVLFASNAYVQAPLTHDLATVEQLLKEALIGFAGQQTAIGDALALSTKRLMDNPADSRTVILLTDGANNAGTIAPLTAAELAQKAKVTVHTIAFGTDSSSQGFFGFTQSGDDYDEATLQQIATMTHGKYFRARNRDELISIYETINELERREIDNALFHPKHDFFYWPLGIAMLLVLLLFWRQQNQLKVAS